MLTIHIGMSMVSARREFERALANSVVVSKRSSVKVRMEKFVTRAKWVMILSFLASLLLVIFAYTLGVCEECRKRSAWAVLPVMTLLCCVWIFRAMVVSILASRANR